MQPSASLERPIENQEKKRSRRAAGRLVMREIHRVFLLTAALLLLPTTPMAQKLDLLGLEMTRLELSLELDYENGSLQGSASYDITNRSERPAGEIPFNLGRLMTVRSAELDGGEPVEFTQDVNVFADDPRRQVNHVVISLPRSLGSKESIVLRLEYGGFLVGYRETGSLYIQDRVPWEAVASYLEDGDFCILRTDAYAWPALGTLRRAVNRAAPRSEFTFRAEVSVPDSYVVASAGRLLRQTSHDGRSTFLYESLAPVPFLNLPIARYGLEESEGVRVYHFLDDEAGGRRVLESTRSGLDLLSAWFGPLNDPPDVVIMEIPEMWGSQASLTGGIIQTADAFREGASMTPVYHELSHLWNAKDLDQPSARWNEGLATFLQYRMAQELEGSSLEEGVRRAAEGILTTASGNPELFRTPFRRYGEAGLTDLSYRVGCLMFDALFTKLGPEVFDDALGSYYEDHELRGGTFEDLTEAFQNRTDLDLSGFFHEWIDTAGWYDQLRDGAAPETIGFRR
jgi:hypothetical protein